jgi:hypothetical protein
MENSTESDLIDTQGVTGTWHKEQNKKRKKEGRK